MEITKEAQTNIFFYVYLLVTRSSPVLLAYMYAGMKLLSHSVELLCSCHSLSWCLFCGCNVIAQFLHVFGDDMEL